MAIANGVENTLQAQLPFDVPTKTIEFIDVSITLQACEVDNCDFEDLYFHQFLTEPAAYLKTFEYDYGQNSNGTKRL